MKASLAVTSYSYLEDGRDMIVSVQHTFLLGYFQCVIWSDVLPATQFLDGGVNNDIVDGLSPGGVPHTVPTL